jgi:hypothetical protein
MLKRLGALFQLVAAALPAIAFAGTTLSNEKVTATFDDRGLVSLHDADSHATYHFSKDDFAVTLGGRTFDSTSLDKPTLAGSETLVRYAYSAGPYVIDVEYELKADWHFVSKRISVSTTLPGKFRLNEITVFRTSLSEPVQEAYVIARGRPNLGTGDYGACLRFARSRGILVAAQNPFLEFQRQRNDFSLRYKPDMDWDASWGAYQADRGLLAPYERLARSVPEKMLPEWSMDRPDERPGMDEAEVQAFTEMVRALLLFEPTNPLNIMVGWCANDYQIDIGTAEGRTEYKRILDMASSLGAEHVLFAPANSQTSVRAASQDDWGWEYVLWLGLGQKIRRGEWDLEKDAIPASVQAMLDYAKSKKLHLVAYVYPVMGFEHSNGWLTGPKRNRANLGNVAFQEWLIGALEQFLKRTGISGYSFDHTFLGYEGASKYAQWWGWRRIMERLRTDFPDIVIDGRQAYQLYGPWTWLAGSYPHPTSTDEQPESFVSFPDLKLDRVSADRERYTAYRYRNYEFAPSEIVPGFITHQTGRNDDGGHMPEVATPAGKALAPFRQRDWDYLGWRYSLISSIAVAGWNNVLDMIPARDPEEFRSFSEEDQRWFRHWIDWADANREYLRHTRTILGQPALGKTDGTAAIVGDRGYVFLFNPNGRRLPAEFPLDETIGLKDKKGKYLVREIYPREDRLIGKPGAGLWTFGDSLRREMDGGSAAVLQIEPAEEAHETRLFNASGTAKLDGRTLVLENVRGEAGTVETLLISASSRVDSVRLGNLTLPARTLKGGLLEVDVKFPGTLFRHYQQLDQYNPTFTGGTVKTAFTIPQRIFDQLAERRKAWPIPWTREDYRSTWLAPERLLLFVQLAEPDDHWTASLKIDGRPVELLKAYASVRSSRRNFTGFYADISTVTPDREHTLELELPTGLKPGQFQGVFVENVETEYSATR